VGFGAFGKHLRNVAPIFLGGLLAAFIGKENPGIDNYIVAMLFSTSLAPIAGQYGLIWGAIAGVLHVNLASHTAYLSGGMNLYANGFAAGFVAMFLLPVITIFRKDVNQ
jgi:hypothetical protein